MADVGIILSSEATRLARNNSDWYRLIDLCTIFDTLLGDYQGIYDPKNLNDRLLLGMKGTISEAELNLIKFRMKEGRFSKARRGELYSVLPTGYMFSVDGIVVKSADKREREVIELIFKKFKELGSARQTYLWFHNEQISIPVNGRKDIEDKKRRWRLPNYSFIQAIIHNPFYAGSYVYGRRGSRVLYKDGRIKKTCGHYKSPEEWEVLIHDHHEGYISWQEWEENNRIMRNNSYSNNRRNDAVGAIRSGKALLVGLLRCQRCGSRIYVRYWGKNGINPYYQCSGDFSHAGRYCQAFSAKKTDSVFEEELFKAIEPAALAASIEAGEVIKQKHQDKIAYLSKELEMAQYEANRAFTQYNQVDPLNRLVASEVERRWNEKLLVVEEIKERIGKENKDIVKPTEEEINKIQSLSKRLPEIWLHPEMDPAIKKRIIRLVVEEVLILLEEDKLLLTMTIHWKGGIHTQVQFKKPVRGDSPPNKTDVNMVEMLKRLSPYYPDEEIARIFNCNHFKTGNGNPWNRTRVRSLRASSKIAPFDRTKKRKVVSLSEAARRLDVNTYTVRNLIKRGIIKARQIIEYAPFVIENSELEKETVSEIIKRLKSGENLRSINRVNERQLRLF
jgi:DNA invertase Pin-like site-specific DNA recombinase